MHPYSPLPLRQSPKSRFLHIYVSYGWPPAHPSQAYTHPASPSVNSIKETFQPIIGVSNQIHEHHSCVQTLNQLQIDPYTTINANRVLITLHDSKEEHLICKGRRGSMNDLYTQFLQASPSLRIILKHLMGLKLYLVVLYLMSRRQLKYTHL